MHIIWYRWIWSNGFFLINVLELADQIIEYLNFCRTCWLLMALNMRGYGLSVWSEKDKNYRIGSHVVLQANTETDSLEMLTMLFQCETKGPPLPLSCFKVDPVNETRYTYIIWYESFCKTVPMFFQCCNTTLFLTGLEITLFFCPKVQWIKNELYTSNLKMLVKWQNL